MVPTKALRHPPPSYILNVLSLTSSSARILTQISKFNKACVNDIRFAK